MSNRLYNRRHNDPTTANLDAAEALTSSLDEDGVECGINTGASASANFQNRKGRQLHRVFGSFEPRPPARLPSGSFPSLPPPSSSFTSLSARLTCLFRYAPLRLGPSLAGTGTPHPALLQLAIATNGPRARRGDARRDRQPEQHGQRGLETPSLPARPRTAQHTRR